MIDNHQIKISNIEMRTYADVDILSCHIILECTKYSVFIYYLHTNDYFLFFGTINKIHQC